VTQKKYPIVVLLSGNGSNLQALIDAQDRLDFEIRAVISNCADAYGLIRAQQSNIPTEILPHQNFVSREQFDHALQESIDKYTPKLIVLAGFMRRLGNEIVKHFTGRMINIHPSLLPKYPGLNPHQKVIAAGDHEHGVSIHFVTDDLDAGPIICQTKLQVAPADNAETLKSRIHQLEHLLYPLTIQWFAEGKIKLKKDQVLLDGIPLNPKGYNLKFN
jgi:phosphoribosylglycinamide formyltransferase-1